MRTQKQSHTKDSLNGPVAGFNGGTAAVRHAPSALLPPRKVRGRPHLRPP